MSPLAGRVALVTGAGRGLGAAHARLLAANGVAVVVNDASVGLDGVADDADVAGEVAASIVDSGGQAVAERSDISTFEGAQTAVDRALDAFGGLDIVVNNAGILVTDGITELSQEDLEHCLAVHVVGTAGVARAAFPHLRAQHYGRIVNTLSEAALGTGYGAGVAYAAAKAAIWGLTMALADEGAPHGITVNAVSPGAHTRMSAGHLRAADLAPEHVSRVVLALISAEDITGRVVHAAGGAIREYRLRREADTDLTRRLAAPAPER
jgi:NAD(P)-dependent dehydrogenase (short-subunit alcohol dehydrogenase family)